MTDGAYHMQTRFRPKPDGRRDPAGEAGWYLERERLARGLTLEKVGQEIGIHPHHLEAIETGDLSRLPPRREALEMIGAYAAYLNFDAQRLVRHYAQLMPRDGGAGWFSSARIISFPLIRRLKDFPAGASGIVASVLAAVLLFGGAVWVLAPGSEEPGEGWTEITAEAPADETGRNGGNVADAGGPAADERPVASISALAGKAARESEASGGSELDAIGQLILQTVPGLEEDGRVTRTASTADGKTDRATPVAKAGKTAAAAVTYRLRAVRDIWLQVEDMEGRPLFSGDLKAGSSFTLPEGLRPADVIITSNDGGALEILAGEKVMKPRKADGEAIVGQTLADLIGMDGRG
jgi:cytoskeletal protein RodZ